jgi:hypothetical protein
VATIGWAPMRASGQDGCEAVIGDARCDVLHQRSPLPPRGREARGHRLVELALPDSGRLVSLNRTGGPPVDWADAYRRPPHFDVTDHVGWWLASIQPNPPRSLTSTYAEADPLRQLYDGRCSGGQIATPHLVFLEVLGNGR